MGIGVPLPVASTEQANQSSRREGTSNQHPDSVLGISILAGNHHEKSVTGDLGRQPVHDILRISIREQDENRIGHTEQCGDSPADKALTRSG